MKLQNPHIYTTTETDRIRWMIVTLILNLPGAVKEVRIALTNKGCIEGIYRFTEEFYKTLSVLAYPRYRQKRMQVNFPLDAEIVNHIHTGLRKPTFFSWIKMVDLCLKRLADTDRFGKIIVGSLKRKLSSAENQTAKLIIRRIHEFDETKDYQGPKKQLTPDEFLNEIRILRNDRSHRWDSEANLQPLIDSGIRDFVLELVEKVFSTLDIRIWVPVDVSEKYLRAYLFEGINQTLEAIDIHKARNYEFGSCYLQYFQDEEPFLFKTDLIEYETDRNQPYVYLALKRFQYESVPLQGRIHAKSGRISSFEDAFGLLGEHFQTSLEKPTQADVNQILDLVNNERERLPFQAPQPLSKWLGEFIDEMEIENTVSNVFIGSFWKEYASKWNLEWNRRKWYRDLIIESVRRLENQ